MAFLREAWLWNEFESLVVFSTIRLKGEVNFFIEQFFEVFYFPKDLQQKVAENDFREVSVLSKCFQSLGIELIISLYIFYRWE